MVSSLSPLKRAVLLVDSTYSLRMISAFERIAESLPLAYKIITFNVDKLGGITKNKIGSSGNELKTLVADENQRPKNGGARYRTLQS